MNKKIFVVLTILVVAFSQLNAAKRAPFLINDMIPHLTMDLKNNWENKELSLKDKQKEKLLIVRKETISSVMSLKKKLAPLEKEIASKIKMGATPEELMSLVNKVAKLKVKATKTHLNCVYRTQNILSKKQLKLLSTL